MVSLRIPPTLPEPRLRFWKVSAPASALAKLHLFLSILTPSGAKLHLSDCTLRASGEDTSDETL